MGTSRVTDMLGIRIPILQAGMIWCSGADLAAAVSNAGAIGIIGGGSMDPDRFRAHIHKARELTPKPFGVNIPLFYKHVEGLVQVALEERPVLVVTSAGTPKKYTAQLKAKGMRVFHVTSTPGLARKCEESGVDGVIAEGFEAGGHVGRDELTTLVLVPQVVDAVRIPVIAAGGIANGRQMAAALALGAEAVQVGTRFALTQESSAHLAFQEACMRAAPEDTKVVIKKGFPVRLLKNPLRERLEAAEQRNASLEELLQILGPGASRLGMFTGDTQAGELEIGQVAGMIRDRPPAAEVVSQLVRESFQASQKLRETCSAFPSQPT